MWAFYTICNTVWPLALVSDLLLLLICTHLLSYLLVLAFEQVSGFLVIVKALFRCLFSEGLTLIDLSSWCEVVVEISFIFFMINILNFLLQYKMVGNIFLNEEIFSFYIFKKLLFSKSITTKKSFWISPLSLFKSVSLKRDRLFSIWIFWCNFLLFILLKNAFHGCNSSNQIWRLFINVTWNDKWFVLLASFSQTEKIISRLSLLGKA